MREEHDVSFTWLFFRRSSRRYPDVGAPIEPMKYLLG
nr:MAG TPA: hypothetical protein [Caudoviricetes sp.]